MSTGSTILLIPAYRPSQGLVNLIASITALDDEHVFAEIVVVDDGSGSEYENVFTLIEKNPKVRLLRHAVNLGKGAALKTGFNFALINAPDVDAIVTADADGQHAPDDILRVARASLENRGALVLGARVFRKGIPFRSRIGNQLTRLITFLFTGLKFADTQTGLRAWPRELCMTSLKIAINGYDFEMESLFLAKQHFGDRLKVIQVPIQTIYEDRNQSSKFNPFFDSMRIYFVFVRYCGASLTTVFVDYFFFASIFFYFRSIGLSMIVGRAVAIMVSFYLNRNLVFHNHQNPLHSFMKFLVVVISFGFVSYFSIHYLHSNLGLNVIVSKALAETVLFFAGFVAINLFVFRSEPSSNNGLTDWNTYYVKPYKTASLTRRMTARLLKSLIGAYIPKGGEFRIAELGGANSSFFDMIYERYEPTEYHIYDNNYSGLEKTRERIGSITGVRIHNEDILCMPHLGEKDFFDMVFSIGLIEHFDAIGTSKAIEAHFNLLKPSGIAIISFPTPTFLYRATRSISELLNLWIFHDERPLKIEEVAATAEKHGAICFKRIIWQIVLTQYILVIRKK
jgi:glycosyltransferase involved in cell wall biosynthesis